MSKLINQIEAVQTGRVKLMPASPITSVDHGMQPCVEVLRLGYKEYVLQVKFSVKGFAQDDAEFLRLMTMAKRQIVEEVFGEFRSHLRTIERHLYELDIDDAKAALRDLENEMFS